MTEKLSVLSRLGSGFNRCNFPSFCLKPLEVKCFEYLLKCKDIVAVLAAGFGTCLLFQLLPDFLPVKATMILCKIGLTSRHDFYGAWHLYICRFLFGHSTFLSLTCVYDGYFMLCRAVKPCYGKCFWGRRKSAWFPLLSPCSFVEFDTSAIFHV